MSAKETSSTYNYNFYLHKGYIGTEVLQHDSSVALFFSSIKPEPAISRWQDLAQQNILGSRKKCALCFRRFSIAHYA